MTILAKFIGRSRQTNDGAAPQPSRAVRQAIALCHALLSEQGEISGVRIASAALMAYRGLDESAREDFFELLLREFSPDPEEVGRAGDAYRDDPSGPNLLKLQHVVEPARQELFRRLNMAPGGTRAIVEMRGRVLQGLRRRPAWAPIEADLAHLLYSWFNRGFLALRRIDWNTSASILEKLIRYEAVHEIQGWPDLRRRLEIDRRCYAFFHPALPDEPIIFIEVALTRRMSARVQPLLQSDSPVLDAKAAACAMFYSITNCQEGLRGVPFGSFLIKKVVEDLGREFPRLRTFATLSPIPGFREWLAAEAAKQENAALSSLSAKLDVADWFRQESSADFERELQRLCAYYLLHAKQGKEPLDSVARFHLRNGAVLDRLNWLGDTSATGLSRSAGIMANYVYNAADVERNHEAYTKDLKVTASRRVHGMARESLLWQDSHVQKVDD
jgi:malonyl-CoA decarboxylase